MSYRTDTLEDRLPKGRVRDDPESIEHHSPCPRCGFMVDEFVLEDVIEHIRYHRRVPWRAWRRDPRRAWQATFGS